MDFSNKFVLVTGGSRGIGQAIVEAFASYGACVAIHYHTNREEAEKTLNNLMGGPHFIVQADVSDPDQSRHLIDVVTRKFGKLDIVVNNAGLFESHPLEESSYEEWKDSWMKTLNLNLLAPANVTYCAARFMMENGGGRIVNISSRGAFRGEPEAPAYAASKAGLNAMTQSLARALVKYKIFLGVVAPGFVETDMTADVLAGPEGDEIRKQSPFHRVARPEEVARAVLFLASEGTEFMTGDILDVNGASYFRT
ncbi:MAG: SDR family NAD(P)-dependent oxidoreductase [Candidatus Omnitrophota bacterium]